MAPLTIKSTLLPVTSPSHDLEILLKDPHVTQEILEDIIREKSLKLTRFATFHSLFNLGEKSQYERKKAGIFYTPDAIVKLVLSEIGYPPLHTKEIPPILDLCCGSGQFLTVAMQKVIALLIQQNIPWRQVTQIAAKAVQGVEKDPYALNVTRYRLLSLLLECNGKMKIPPPYKYT